MGRKSRALERREEILAAFERCIVQYGLDVSLERVADVAGVQRSIIRHYIGNRDVVIEELIERITHNYVAQMSLTVQSIADGEGLLDFLFSADPTYADWEKIVVDILVSAQERFPQAKQRLTGMFQTLLALLTQQLARLYPHAPPAHCEQIAYGLFCIATTNDTMTWIGFAPAATTGARSSAALLLATLAAHP